uniref:Uncharacterized protein n=1 Tax=Molossus molossus TaxID=27622 RepID=A0A7J8J0Q9_MOLMO|nr:hypothetical protein HJG59_010319 [Molossus molossus]
MPASLCTCFKLPFTFSYWKTATEESTCFPSAKMETDQVTKDATVANSLHVMQASFGKGRSKTVCASLARNEERLNLSFLSQLLLKSVQLLQINVNGNMHSLFNWTESSLCVNHCTEQGKKNEGDK